MANAERDINAQLGIFVAESDWQFDINNYIKNIYCRKIKYIL
jgi:hypothetical protein